MARLFRVMMLEDVLLPVCKEADTSHLKSAIVSSWILQTQTAASEHRLSFDLYDICQYLATLTMEGYASQSSSSACHFYHLLADFVLFFDSFHTLAQKGTWSWSNIFTLSFLILQYTFIYDP